ncbi:hypothetical protein PF005_g15544 [Phytophthora fragariae]|uniref:Uncharacterized protein n=2 Tax=Phytophthora TaxID=4783 RepID=A0A6A3YC67_9STRA|nr:hypothetical protein PF003_g38295 [Phytophthora fragariae]KAE8963327.1 hypothetical protein PR001_g29412 [Phytophthora rubi]KAE8933146.1 hypothetical protein PF009_g16849 [Phytophthora fragariae]KAE8964530.1 hypothetical protein PF011_g28633 [Phytophthora fragariae]KAE8965721.1 hypothetical protein PR002_g28596 [Phytophthora rubi]
MEAIGAVALLLHAAEQHDSNGRHRCSSTVAEQHGSNGRHRCSSTATTDSRAA